MIIETFALIVIIFLILWLYFEAPFYTLNKTLEPIPGPKPLPIIGNLLDIRREKKGALEYFIKCSKKYGPVFKVHFPKRITVFLSNPDDIELILRSNELLHKSDVTIKFFKPWIGDGLLINLVPRWREQRKLITPAFHYNNLEKYFEVFKEQTNILMDILKNKTNINLNIFPLLQLFALDVICETAMGTKIEAQTKTEGNFYVEAVNQTTECVSARLSSLISSIPILDYFTPTRRRLQDALNILKSTSKKIIQARRDQLIKDADKIPNGNVSELGEKKRVVFLDLLLQARHTDGRPLSNQEICDEVETFMFAGHDTTSTQMSFLLYLLAKEPEIQERLYKEQCELLGGEKRDPTFNDIQNMHFLERCIKESQRLLTSLPGYDRQLVQDLKLKTNGYIVPKGVQVNIFAHQVHLDPKLYPNPEKFDPDRFLPENIRNRSTYAFIPFSAGPRNCIGHKFAMLEMKTCISNIIRHFKILPAIDTQGKRFEPEIRLIIVIHSINGIYIRLSPRQ